MALAIFDLDETLLNGDSDFAFGQFMVSEGIVDKATYERENEQFKQAYLAGVLDIIAYSRFCLSPLTQFSETELQGLHQKFMQDYIAAMLQAKAKAKLQYHRDQDDYIMVITATNGFVATPVAKSMGVETILATEPEYKAGRITGEIVGMPCYQEGKVIRLKQWLSAHPDTSLEGSYFYSDSFNDIPLLSLVSNPVAVDPDKKLNQHAQKLQWPIISFR